MADPGGGGDNGGDGGVDAASAAANAALADPAAATPPATAGATPPTTAGVIAEDPQRLGWRARLFGRRRRVEQMRVVMFPHAAHTLRHPHGGQPSYRGNRTSTTKYTLLSFLPKALFEQYRRVANVYFTLNAALSLTPYSPVRPWTTFLPLGLVLGVAMAKEAAEDYKRYRQDVEVNARRVEVFDAGAGDFVARTWAQLRVGDIITVYKVIVWMAGG